VRPGRWRAGIAFFENEMNNDDPGSRTDTTLAPAQGAPRAEIVVMSGDWAASLPDHESLAKEAALAALSCAGQAGAGHVGAVELCITLADDATLRDLNQRFRGQDKPTNVLAFALAGADTPGLPEAIAQPLGDVVLALETLQREAGEQDKPLADHFRHLVVHGVLHLLGHDHQDDEEARVMEALEARVLASLGVADPYAEEKLVGGAA
jgi:probable rRNA maturation factor